MKHLLKYLNVFRSSCTPLQISLACSLGVLLGLGPSFFALQTFLVILMAIFLRLPWRHLLASLAIAFILAAIALDSLLDQLGSSILGLEAFQGLFHSLYQVPFLSWTRFNNSIFMAAFCLSIALFPIFYFMTQRIKARS